MRPEIILKTLLTFLFIVGGCFGQEIVEDENWLKGLGTEAGNLPTLIYPFTKFTTEDLTKGKQRLKTVRRFAPKDEWEGIYYSDLGMGDSMLIWNLEGGFFDFFFYHYLKRFDYGIVNNSPGFVELASEKPSVSVSKEKKSVKTRLIKVKIGDKRFLVPEIRLLDFCKTAAGLGTDLDDIFYYWVKEEDLEKEDAGLPLLPQEYRHFLRYPVEAKIVGIGKRKTIPNEQSTAERNFDDIHYTVTLDAGRNKNVKVKMNFFIEDLGEWVEITKVLQTKSFGFIRRDFDENNKEQCWDSEGGSGQMTPCREIKVGMKAKTKVNGM